MLTQIYTNVNLKYLCKYFFLFYEIIFITYNINLPKLNNNTRKTRAYLV